MKGANKQHQIMSIQETSGMRSKWLNWKGDSLFFEEWSMFGMNVRVILWNPFSITSLLKCRMSIFRNPR